MAEPKTMKQCNGCSRTLPVSSFEPKWAKKTHWRERRKKGWSSLCRACKHVQNKEHERLRRDHVAIEIEINPRVEHPPTTLTNRVGLSMTIKEIARTGNLNTFAYALSTYDKPRVRRLKSLTVVSASYILVLAAAQHFKCAICQASLADGYQIDHCHETGKVRGLLCHHCNTAVSLLNDSVERAQRTIDYLKRGLKEKKDVDL